MLVGHLVLWNHWSLIQSNESLRKKSAGVIRNFLFLCLGTIYLSKKKWLKWIPTLCLGTQSALAGPQSFLGKWGNHQTKRPKMKMAYKSPQASLCQVVTWTKAPSSSWCALRFACLGNCESWNVETGTSASSPRSPTWEFEMMVLQTASLIIPPNRQWIKTVEGNRFTKDTLCLIFPQGVSRRIHFW